MPQVLGFQQPPLQIIGIDDRNLLLLQAQEQEKKLLEKKGMYIDRSFHLYAVIRRASAEVALALLLSCSLALSLSLSLSRSLSRSLARSHSRSLALSLSLSLSIALSLSLFRFLSLRVPLIQSTHFTHLHPTPYTPNSQTYSPRGFGPVGCQ